MSTKSKLPPGAFWFPDENHRPLFGDSSGADYKCASHAFYALADLLLSKHRVNDFSVKAIQSAAVNTPHFPETGEFYPRGLYAQLCTGDQKQVKALNELFKEIQLAIEMAHQHGIEKGKSLLIQPAKGTITSKQFNDATVEEEAP